MTALAPKDRPIIFSAPMVRALLDGRKSQTRRILKPQPEPTWTLDATRWPAARVGRFWFTDDPAMPGNHVIHARFEPSDRLWVREAWSFIGQQGVWELSDARPDTCKPFYRADGARADRWWPSIHMPRWASRLTLIVTDVRVQRLQDISDEDAKAEGAQVLPLQDANDPSAWWQIEPGVHQGRTPRAAFRKLWDSINGPDAWAANPWVVAVSFKTICANIDSAEAKAA